MNAWKDGLIAAAAIITALTVLIGVVVKTYKLTKSIDAAIGKDSDGHTLADNVRTIKSVLFPVGSLSLPQRVDQIETEVSRTQTAVERIGTKLDVIETVVIRGEHTKERKHEE